MHINPPLTRLVCGYESEQEDLDLIELDQSGTNCWFMG